ncbi:MAG: DUF4349 domain-containing protein [Aquabacterium sp.]|uniref:DUF4349 domain-containing protein n=1 Tax=Aquabacterium sp. TaxID=1872578 RepID=UPI0011F8B85D|nr:DUF4349 domain-containing protein [Aquabacterium sp.]TAK91162.1 MAG: DUF4349 domain-containing protein [Aquabacterium sp.]
MTNRLPFIALAASLVLSLSACSKKEETSLAQSTPSRAMSASAKSAAQPSGAAEQAKDTQAATRRYLALSHHLVIESSGQDLQAQFDGAMSRAVALGAEVLSARIGKEGPLNRPSAELSLRLPPQAVEGFLASLSNARAQIQSHQRDSEDKTDQVIDAEARIKNLTDLRDRLRAMLASRPGNIKDVLDIEKELADTQAQLDTVAGLRKALANETDKVLVHIQFQARLGVQEDGFFAPVSYALQDAGRVLVQSLAGLITFVAAVLPWLLILVPGAWLLRRGIRTMRTRRAARP